MNDVKPEYLIRKRGAYYRPNSQGYTTSAIQAGRYTLEEARDISHPNGPKGPRDGMDYIHESEIRCEDWRDYIALRARLDAVTEERNVQNDLRQIAEDAADELRARAERAEAALATARRDVLEQAARMIEAIVKEAISENGPAKSSPDIAAVEMLKSIVSAIRALANEDPT